MTNNLGYLGGSYPITTVTPFSYRSGATMMEIMERFKKWAIEMGPEVQLIVDGALAKWQDEFDALENKVNLKLGEWDALFNAFMANVVAELEGLNDQAVANLVRNNLSELHQALIEFTDTHSITRGTDIVTIRDFGAVGDGITDDTDAWNSFQNATGFKLGQPGRYRVNGTIKHFINGFFGNGEFDDATAAWDQPMGDHERHSILVHRNVIDANVDTVSPVIKTQTQVHTEHDTPIGSFKDMVGAYHEGTFDGYYNTQLDTNQNYTVLGSTAKNRMSGLFGALAHLAYVEDVTELENPMIASIGATKNGCSFLRFTRKAQHKSGGYMFGQEIYCQNQANEIEDVPYLNNDFFSWSGSWTAGIKIAGNGGGAPISAAMFTHGMSGARHGFWNGLVIGATGFKINSNGMGYPGTVGINLASWRDTAGYADIGIKFRTANRHLHFNEGAKVRVSLMRFINDAGNAGLSVESGSGGSSYVHFRNGATDAPDGGNTNIQAQIDVNHSWTRLQSNTGEVHLAASGGSATYVANSARFAPATVNNGTQQLGAADRRWDNIYAVSGVINTSDERAKTEIGAIPDDALDAWGDVMYAQYRFTDAVASKDGARLHTGVVAQAVIEAFENRGLNAADYGLLCHDEWGAIDETVNEYTVTIKEPVHEQILVKDAEFKDIVQDDGTVERIETMPAEYEDGEELEPAVTELHRDVTPAREAGDMYGIRYEEALCFEAAYQRRRGNLLEERIARLENLILV